MGLLRANSCSGLAVRPAAVLTWQPFYLQGTLGTLCIMGKSEYSHFRGIRDGESLTQRGLLSVWSGLRSARSYLEREVGSPDHPLLALSQLLLSRLAPPTGPSLSATCL